MNAWKAAAQFFIAIMLIRFIAGPQIVAAAIVIFAVVVLFKRLCKRG